MILHTPRLLLRPFTPSDRPAIHAYASDPEVVTHMDWGPNTLEDTTTHLQETLKNQHSDDRNFPFAVVLKSDLGTAFVPPDQVYQHKRIHSALGYLTPAEFEAQWLTKQLP